MPNVHTFTSVESSFLVNSFIVETNSGLVLIDTQFLVSSARQLANTIRTLDKPLLAVIITHPHPDHFNGMSVIDVKWPGLPIYATQATLHGIRAIEGVKRKVWTAVYGDDYPQQTILPNTVVTPGETLVIDGLELHIDDIGEGESSDITVIHLPQSNALIASDLLYHRVHPWLAEGRTRQWLNQLEIVRTRYASVKTVYAGHGKTGTLEALAQQADYLEAFRAMVRNSVADLQQPTSAEKHFIADEMRRRYRGYPLAALIQMNVDGVANELANEILLVRE